MTWPVLRFDLAEAVKAYDEFKFNCGPASLCAVLGMTPAEIRPHLLDFEEKHYTNPTLMAEILRGMRIPFRRIFECAIDPAEVGFTPVYPTWGLCRIQWAGPWTKPSVPMRVRYKYTHWTSIRGSSESREVFDLNAIGVGGWLSWQEWSTELVPWILKQVVPGADGRYWPTHCWEVGKRKG